jgi:iron complex transport system permease protein
VLLAVLALLMVLSLAVGARPMSLGVAWTAIVAPDGSPDSAVVHDLRVPRTLLGLAAGTALGLAGVLMQALTRNALADPGLLGVNVGASTGVVIAVAVFGIGNAFGYIWFAFAGAAGVSVVVYLIGSAGRTQSPDRMVLAGAAVAAVLGSFTSALLLIDPLTFDQFRNWVVGSLAGRSIDVLAQLTPFFVVGSLLALGLGRALNTVALGDEAGRALGLNLLRTRVLGVIGVTLLCGSATAAVGPIAFLGLTVPHLARMITGPDHRWLLPYAMLISPILLLAADVLGRVLVRPSEIEVGIVVTALGAPVFVALCRRRRLIQL